MSEQDTTPRAHAEVLARAQCSAAEIEAVMRVRFDLALLDVLSPLEIGRLQRCGQAELRLRLWDVAMGHTEGAATATSTAMWLSRQSLGHRSDARGGDAEVREMAERFTAMTEAELGTELDRMREVLVGRGRGVDA